ncbi:MAG: hypothetical protein GF311_14060 [Candidatus Lokiarchaeota archaeon]|jgi:hypothetical protein|nr:hypothetical protein [Candidatus Lokiarchaeota archaeon]
MVKLFGKKTKQILEKFSEEQIILVSKGANFFGVESKSYKQIRGNGVLILTRDQLFFQLWLPKRIIKIPLDNIIRVEKTTHHLRKIRFVDLLKVEFTNKEGEADSVAWWVKDLEQWIAKIQALM